MASETISLAVYSASDPIAVTPLQPVGIDTSAPVTIETEDGSLLTPETKERHALVVIPVTDTIIIKTRDKAATVIVTTPDE